ncbi:tropinone reductase-like 1 isoform X1 [Eucalyptus grandis]|uniref:tropinone reductase-like 1 isoform X1 n=1 Tax=Eucalyptus grandis TaxID=71139 RepID=UPI00192EAD0F|nr:tropinone reductase-like 1 isoform X1 [Eucalyptus grandis]
MAPAETPFKRLEGKVAIITGGASGIGASAASLFHQHGAWVVIADIQDEPGQALAAKLGQRASYARCDVSIEADVRDLVDATVAKHGWLDVMYNNAGVLDRNFGGIIDTSLTDLDRVLRVNLYGAFHGAKHAARVMVPQRRGCILFTGSNCTAIAGVATHTYAASKQAVVGLARGLAAELGEHGIRVNCVSPHAVSRTGMSGLGKLSEDELARVDDGMRVIGNLKGRVLAPESVARAALYLASDEADYVSGLNMVVDGGYSVVNPSMMMALAASRSVGKVGLNV